MRWSSFATALLTMSALGLVTACLDFEKAKATCETQGRCVDGGVSPSTDGATDAGGLDGSVDGGSGDGGVSDGGLGDGGLGDGGLADGGSCEPANCAGCCQGGQCVPVFVQTDAVCGTQTSCAACPMDWHCDAGACVRGLGADCAQDVDCAALAGGLCRKVTARGNGVYDGGYCTATCATEDECGSTGHCQTVSAYGEDSRLCFRKCDDRAAGGQCRPGYACAITGPNAVDYALGTDQTFGPAICFIGPPPSQGDAGPVDIGKPCVTQSDCPSPYSAQCIPFQADAGTVWPSGYCSADCRQGDSVCGFNGLCAPVDQAATVPMAVCLQKCSVPANGPCRPGYHCAPASSAPDAGPDGFCWPNCNPAIGCSDTTYTCLPSGLCCQSGGTNCI